MLAIIGGSGMDQLPGLKLDQQRAVQTPYAAEPVVVQAGTLEGASQDVAFLPRHGADHAVPPHRINYRANIFALHKLAVSGVLAVNAVGGLSPTMGPGVIAIPDQIIDYTWGREHTFFDGSISGIESPDQFSDTVAHIDFTEPYDADLRQLLIDAAVEQGVVIQTHGTYAATQGPRLETPAEVRRLLRDGSDLVGMTGMPEAALAREIGLPYACVALSVNWAAGISDELITMDSIRQVLEQGMGSVRQILQAAIRLQD
ncbi:S-methyl-5'-thioinosine phosphorylase [Pseudohongiella spirulinae]|uniref:Probable S-methyl-5'-thioinosine phosphorylase n=1 Tax=Pseudohongiella spirulinae TaxID=1249552 RepID=A0A0S2KDX8_9GAMM|nr:S-methyl-5'-thioinosine phosphorylase [Pseudohongiella spirulinae]ALO46524.1 Purine nucleoside phosphorylase [Pseudohongiella spirulinae]